MYEVKQQKMIPSLKSLKSLKNTRGATLIVSMGLAMAMIIVALGVGMTIRSTGQNIKSFKNATQAQISALSLVEVLKLSETEGGGYLVSASGCDAATAEVWQKITCGDDGNDDNCINIPTMDTDRESGNVLSDRRADTNSSGENALKALDIGGSQSASVAAPLELSFSCEVVGVGQTPVAYTASDSFYVIPGAGKGQAARGCDTAKFPLDEGSDSDATINLDDPCNWNTFSFESPATAQAIIPLYFQRTPSTEEFCPSSGWTPGAIGEAETCDFANANGLDGEDTMILRVRTPCKDGSTKCENIDRYEFDDGDGTNKPHQNNVVVYWKISGECETGACTLIPIDKTDTAGRRIISTYNSEIYESEVNTANNGNWEVWDTSNDRGQEPGKNYDFPNIQPKISEWLATVSKPTLQFILMAPDMKSRQDQNITKIEYQLLSKKPISTPETIYRVQVNYMGQSYKVEQRDPRKGGFFNFTIQN